MATWFVTRHPGAREWAERRGIHIDHMVDHLDPAEVAAGDTVLGTLPVNLVAEINARDVRYFHLILSLSPEARGKEISADLMERLGAHLEAYVAIRLYEEIN